MNKLSKKEEELKEYIKEKGEVAIAYSGGVDSSYLLKVAHEVLKDKAIAITIKSIIFPKREYKYAKEFCEEERIEQITLETDILKIKGYRENSANRCYICKKELYREIKEAAGEIGIKNVLEGTNADDIKDYRPGLKAIKELEIKSPLLEIGISKKEIRELSKIHKLKSSDKSSFACLASRFIYGEEITTKKLKMVEAAEEVLYGIGIKQYRVRIHNQDARIEIQPDEFDKVIKRRKEIIKEYKELGFKYISLDIEGYRTGSMNETIQRYNNI